MNRNYDGSNLFTPRGLCPAQTGGRLSRLKKRFESVYEEGNENSNATTTEDSKDESITKIEAELIQSGNAIQINLQLQTKGSFQKNKPKGLKVAKEDQRLDG